MQRRRVPCNTWTLAFQRRLPCPYHNDSAFHHNDRLDVDHIAHHIDHNHGYRRKSSRNKEESLPPAQGSTNFRRFPGNRYLPSRIRNGLVHRLYLSPFQDHNVYCIPRNAHHSDEHPHRLVPNRSNNTLRSLNKTSHIQRLHPERAHYRLPHRRRHHHRPRKRHHHCRR